MNMPEEVPHNPDPFQLSRLADLIRQRYAIDREITRTVGRPALTGHVGEYIAAAIFGIELHTSASHKGSDGVFKGRPLAGHSVNVKWYGRHESLIDLVSSLGPDYYLVLTGPKLTTALARQIDRPWRIDNVYRFDGKALEEQIVATDPNSKLGIATGVRQHLWEAAEIYPNQQNQALPLSDTQRQLLRLFAYNLGDT